MTKGCRRWVNTKGDAWMISIRHKTLLPHVTLHKLARHETLRWAELYRTGFTNRHKLTETLKKVKNIWELGKPGTLRHGKINPQSHIKSKTRVNYTLTPLGVGRKQLGAIHPATNDMITLNMQQLNIAWPTDSPASDFEVRSWNKKGVLHFLSCELLNK